MNFPSNKELVPFQVAGNTKTCPTAPGENQSKKLLSAMLMKNCEPPRQGWEWSICYEPPNIPQVQEQQGPPPPK